MAVMALPAFGLIKTLRSLTRPALLWLLVLGVADAANVALYFSAVERGPVVVAVMTHYLAPVLVALSAPLVLREPRSRRALIALPVMLAGLYFVLPAGDSSAAAWTTALLGAGSAVFYALVVLGGRGASTSLPPAAVTSLHAVISLVLLLLFFRERAIPSEFTRGVAIVIIGALVNGLLGALLFNFGLKHVEAQLAGVLTYLEPVIAAVIGVFLFAEPASWLTAVGLSLVIGAGVFVTLER